ncbi:MAG: hypothetical protein K2M06_03270 [Muribaculaceae bacterium]|nr:hypothetical protein [Muribaculaceae bacterium]
MKKIIFLFTLIIVLIELTFWANPIQNLTNINSGAFFKHASLDSLYTTLKNRPIIFYSRGHYGYGWSLIARMDSTYSIYSGHVSYSGEFYIDKTPEGLPFDTTKLISVNSALLSWAFDSISVQAVNMKKVNRTPYLSLWTDLSVFNSDSENIFNSDNAVAFAGKDSLAFNKKFNKLCLIMWWLSDSRIREYIPDSAIY